MDEPYIAEQLAGRADRCRPHEEIACWLPPCLCPCDVCDPEPEPDDLPMPDHEIGGEA